EPIRSLSGGAKACARPVVHPPAPLCSLLARSVVLCHKVPDRAFCLWPKAPGASATISPQLGDQVLVVQCQHAELAVTETVLMIEALDFGKEVCHSAALMGDISPIVNPAWGKFRESRALPTLCDKDRMRSIQEI